MFPVKLRTHIGKPIEYDESLNADQLKEIVIITLKYFYSKFYQINKIPDETKNRRYDKRTSTIAGKYFSCIVGPF